MDWRIESHNEVSSTQDIILQKSYEPEGLCVTARIQTQGRGRQARSWVSQEGNFFCSVLLKPNTMPENVGQLSLLIGVALAQTIKPLLSSGNLKLKWPNDLLIDGRKCAGILIENDLNSDGTLNGVVAGIGVNLSSAPEDGASLKEFASTSIELQGLRDSFLYILARLYEDWQNEGFSAIKQQWLDHAHNEGARLSVHVQHDQKVFGTFKGLDERGALIINTDQGVKTITAGDVAIQK